MNKNIGRKNIKFGWCWLFVGILMAMLVGLFAFKNDWFGGYVSLPRRFLRLSHISFMALSLTNVIFGLCIDQANISDKFKIVASYLIIIAAITMPIICIFSIFNLFFQALFFIPAVSFAIAIFITALGYLKEGR